MDHPKKKAIIDACLKEFSEHGYEQANTNRISAEAGVSKGLIFHYFGSKQQLYLLTLDACLKDMIEPFRGLSLKGMGFVPAMLSLSTFKIRFFSEHPRHYRLMMGALYNPPAKLAAEIKVLQAQSAEVAADLVRQLVAELKMKPGVDAAKAQEMIFSLSAIIERKFTEALLQQTEFSEETHKKMEREYMAYLKLLMYGIAQGDGSEGEAFNG